MTKQEISLQNFSQRLGTAYLVLEIGKRILCGKDIGELEKKLRKVQQLNKSFDYEYNKSNSDLSYLSKIIYLIDFYIADYKVVGNVNINEVEINPTPNQNVNFIIISGGATLSFLQLTDTPSSYGGQAGKLVKVKANEQGLEFVDSADSRPLERTLKWSDFVNTGQEGRKRYVSNDLLNWNPQILVDSTISLLVEIDYDIINTGGIELKSTGNIPFIYDEQIVKFVGYEKYSSVPLPTILSQPYTGEVAQGTDITLTVSTINATSYQWYKNNIPIPSAISSSLVITNFQTDDEATYFVKVSNSIGFVNSNNSVLVKKVFYNVQKSGTATKNNCSGTGETGSLVTYIVYAGTYSSVESQLFVDNQAQADVNANKQAYANENGTCIPPVTYPNEAQTVYATRNNCPTGQQGNSVPFTINAGTVNSLISIADANATALAMANAGAQANANTNGTCTVIPVFNNVQKQQDFQKNNCSSGVGSIVTYIVTANTYTSTISQEDADNKALNDVALNGQNYANTNGTCVITYQNELRSAFATRNDCSSGQVGTTEEYIIYPGTYSNTISQASVNAIAQNVADAGAQDYANETGSCVIPTLSFLEYSTGNFYFKLNIPAPAQITIGASVYGYEGACIDGTHTSVDTTGSLNTMEVGVTDIAIQGNSPIVSPVINYKRNLAMTINGITKLNGDTFVVGGITIIVNNPNSCDPYNS